MNNRIKNICSWLIDNRGHVVLEAVRTSDEEVLSETGRCVKYAYELVEHLFPSPIVEAAHGCKPVERADLLCPISSDQTGLSVGENPVIARFSYSVRAGQEVFKDLKAEVKVLLTDQEFAWLSQQNLLAREEGIEYPIYSL